MTSRVSSPLPTFMCHPALPYLGLLVAMLSLAVGTSYAKTLFPLIGAQGTSACRVGLSALILLAIWRPWRALPTRKDLKNILFYGGFLGAMNLMFYISLKTIPLGLALAIEFSGPLMLALIHSRRFIHFVWVTLAVLGLGLLLPIHGHAGALDPVGVMLAAAAGVCWALYIVFGKRLAHVPSGHSVAMGMTVAACIIVPFGITEAGPMLLKPEVLFSGLLVAVFSSALPYTLDMVAIRHIPERTFGVILSAEPAVGAMAGLIILGEYLSTTQWLAIGLIVTAAAGAIATTTKSQVPVQADALTP